jgi:hypothetical protein
MLLVNGCTRVSGGLIGRNCSQLSNFVSPVNCQFTHVDVAVCSEAKISGGSETVLPGRVTVLIGSLGCHPYWVGDLVMDQVSAQNKVKKNGTKTGIVSRFRLQLPTELGIANQIELQFHRPQIWQGYIPTDLNPTMMLCQLNVGASTMYQESLNSSQSDTIDAAISLLSHLCRPEFAECHRLLAQAADAASSKDVAAILLELLPQYTKAIDDIVLTLCNFSGQFVDVVFSSMLTCTATEEMASLLGKICLNRKISTGDLLRQRFLDFVVAELTKEQRLSDMLRMSPLLKSLANLLNSYPRFAPFNPTICIQILKVYQKLVNSASNQLADAVLQLLCALFHYATNVEELMEFCFEPILAHEVTPDAFNSFSQLYHVIGVLSSGAHAVALHALNSG